MALDSLAIFVGCLIPLGIYVFIRYIIIGFVTTKWYPPVQPGGGVIVTGASSGIGKHATKTLAEAGYLVFAGVR